MEKKKSATKKRTILKKTHPKPPIIVAIGASAGGLDAVSALLKNLPSDTGMAFFYVQHLSPNHPSQLSMLLSKSTGMSVQEARHLQKIERNCVFVCVPNRDMLLMDGKIHLVSRPTHKLPYLPIDDFFHSLAANYRENVIGIILSGNATDGTLGLKAIKDAGGVTFAQDGTAKYDSMSKSAIDAGAVDFILSPKEIASELTLLAKNKLVKSRINWGSKNDNFSDSDPDLKKIFGILHKETGIDFSHYKITTINRRLDYRMLHCNVQTLKQYLKVLLKSDSEVASLHKDLLINVTSFFRDGDAFKYLKNTILPELLRKKPEDILRIWVAGCSSGEEAYSIAMLVTELQERRSKKIPVQIFATDLSAQAVKDARIGEYTQRDIEFISKSRVKRFFSKSGKQYRITKELREKCVFAPHNVLRDPPFSRIDLISCCNLLIYFDAAAQKRALSTFSFALKDGGYLMLGKSETVGTSSSFTSVSNKFKIYSKKKSTSTPKTLVYLPDLPKPEIVKQGNTKRVAQKIIGNDSIDLDKAIDSVLLSNYMPSCAIINKDMHILKFRGSTSLFLTHRSGDADLNILKMTRPEFTLELRGAIHSALKTKQVVTCSGLDIKIGSDIKTMSLDVRPLKIDWSEPLLLIIFTLNEKAEFYSGNVKSQTFKSEARTERKLREKLDRTRHEMNNMIEAHESAYEALQLANEEIVSTNEEFQTLNEELETSKEEIEATNEELLSTNQELMMRNDLLTESYKYSEAIIATVHEPMLVLDSNLHVKSANNSFYRKFLVNKEETVGTSVFELGNGQWNIPKLRKLLHDIISKNITFKNLEITHTFPGLGEKIMQLNAHQIVQKTHKEQLVLLAIEDITERARHFLQEKANLKKDILEHKADKLKLERAVKRRTVQLQQKNLELESANKDLTSFTYVSSHDLQEPLRKIRNFAAVLLDEEKNRLSQDGKGYLEKTYETAKRMQALIEDLLTYSRAKNTERKFEKINLGKIVNEVKKDLEDVIKEKQAIIKTGNLSDISVIPSQFIQLFQNLIGNSIKYSKPDEAPVITIKSVFVPGSKLNDLKLLPENDYCHISFTDNGIGFDRQYRERIFEVFQRLHTREYMGTGMGLAICKRIVENHNGVITADGALHKGAKFDIYIPVEDEIVTAPSDENKGVGQ